MEKLLMVRVKGTNYLCHIFIKIYFLNSKYLCTKTLYWLSKAEFVLCQPKLK